MSIFSITKPFGSGESFFFALPAIPIVGRAMDFDFIEQIDKLKLMVEEGEEITIRSTQREKILEEWSLSLIGKEFTAISMEDGE